MPQLIIIFNPKSIRKNLLFGCFIGSSTNSYLCFLYILLYLFVIAGKFLWPYFFSICLSFSHNVLTLSTITSMSLFSNAYLVKLTILYIHKIIFFFDDKKPNNFDGFFQLKSLAYFLILWFLYFQTKSNWIDSLKSKIRSMHQLNYYIDRLVGSHNHFLFLHKVFFLFSLILLTIIWFSSLFAVFISLFANVSNVCPNICLNYFLSMIFDKYASFSLKILSSNSLLPHRP